MHLIALKCFRSVIKHQIGQVAGPTPHPPLGMGWIMHSYI